MNCLFKQKKKKKKKKEKKKKKGQAQPRNYKGDLISDSDVIGRHYFSVKKRRAVFKA